MNMDWNKGKRERKEKRDGMWHCDPVSRNHSETEVTIKQRRKSCYILAWRSIVRAKTWRDVATFVRSYDMRLTSAHWGTLRDNSYVLRSARGRASWSQPTFSSCSLSLSRGVLSRARPSSSLCYFSLSLSLSRDQTGSLETRNRVLKTDTWHSALSRRESFSCRLWSGLVEIVERPSRTNACKEEKS